MFFNKNVRPAFAGAPGMDKHSPERRTTEAFMFDSGESEDFNAFGSSPSQGDAKKQRKAPPEKKKAPGEINGRTLLIAVASAVAVILLIVLIVVIASSGNKDVKFEDNAFATYQGGDNLYYVTMNGSVVGKAFDSEITLQAAADNSFAYLVEHTDDGENIYIVENKKLTPVQEGVDEVLAFATLKPAIVYRVDDSFMYYYDDVPERISKDAGTDNFVISPDGTAISYTKVSDDDPSSVFLCLYKDGVSDTISKNLSPVAVSSKGDYVYAYGISSEDLTTRVLYAITYDDKYKISGGEVTGSYAGISYMNSKGTEIVFYTGSDESNIRSYVYNCEKNPETAFRIANGICIPQVTDTDVAFLGTLAKAYYQDVTNGGTYYVDKNYSSNKIANYAGQFDPDEDYFYYIKKDSSNSALCRMEVNKGEVGTAEAIAANVTDFIVTKKGNLYYLDVDGELSYRKMSAERSQRILSEVTSMTFYEYANELYFEKDSEMDVSANAAYFSEEGSKRDTFKFGKISVPSAPNFTNSYSKKTYAYYYDTDRGCYMLFYTANGRSFKLVASECIDINGIAFGEE